MANKNKKYAIAPNLVDKTRSWRPAIDVWIVLFFSLFFALSVVMVYSPEATYMYQKQLVSYAIATFVLCVVSQIPINMVKRFSPYFYLLGIGFLISVALWGIESKGAQRWLNFGVIHFQPSELFKFLLPLMLAWWLDMADEYALDRLLTWVVVFIVITVSVVLIALQPDLGSALMVLMSGLVVIFLAGLSWKLILAGIFAMILSLPILWMNMQGYQKQRILTFLDPYQDPLGSGYHVIQSMIAIGSGGWLGSGWLQGSQSRLDFVPEQHTDFMFSLVAEEFGFIGAFGLILLYVALVYRGFVIAISANNHFSRVLGVTLSAVIFLHMAVNIGMVLGLLPVVGLPLPLMSYGGSSLISYAIILGLVSSIKCHSVSING